jgi:Scaffold domain
MAGSVRLLRFLMVVFVVAVGTIIANHARSQSSAFISQQPAVLGGKTLTPSGVSALHAIADSGRNTDLRWPNFAPYKAGYSLAWVENGRVRPQGLAVIEILRNANLKGLEPEDYDASRWPVRLSKLAHTRSEQDLVSFDTALTVSAMRYIRAVHVGDSLVKLSN